MLVSSSKQNSHGEWGEADVRPIGHPKCDENRPYRHGPRLQIWRPGSMVPINVSHEIIPLDKFNSLEIHGDLTLRDTAACHGLSIGTD